MIDTITIVSYLLGHHFGHNSKLNLAARFFEKENQTLCEPSTISPNLRWRDVPPEASSLAIIIKDAHPPKKDEKTHYYWVVYNLPIHAMYLPFGASNFMRRYDEGLNSWGEQNYHSRCFDQQKHPVTIELVALDTKISPDQPMTGEILEKKIISSSHVLAKVEYNELLRRHASAH
jgi:hypothetical protein